MKMKLKLIPHLLLTFLVVFAGNSLLAQAGSNSGQQEVIVRGVGLILNGDEAKAEDDAKANALRNAVEQVIGTMIQSDVLVQNYQTIEDNIYSRTAGYVQNYSVVNKNKPSENMLELTVRAVVKKGNLENDLDAIGLLMARKGKPRLMTMIDEMNMDTHYNAWSVDMNTTENALMNKFLEKGFPFVDQATAARKLQRDMVSAALSGDENAARQIANETGAEVLIVGKAIAKPASAGPAVLQQAGMISCQATVNLRAIRADDGSVLATTNQQAAAAHIDQITGGTLALQRATELASNDLSGKILSRWQQDVYSGTTVNLRLLNVESYSDLIKFKNMLPVYVRGVQKVFQRSYSENTALFDLAVTGSANQVAEELIMKDFSPFKIEVMNISQNTIVAKINKQQ
ncbi:MAG: hypothetical protein WAN36_05390 [Calditrichia bacterium]